MTVDPYVLWLPEDSHLVARITDLAGRPIVEKPFKTPRAGDGVTFSLELQIP